MKAIKIASVTALAAAVSAQSMATNFLNGADLTVSGNLTTTVAWDLLNGAGSTSSVGSVGLAVTDGNFNASMTLMSNHDTYGCDDVNTAATNSNGDAIIIVTQSCSQGRDFTSAATGVSGFTVNAGNWSFGTIGALPLAKFFPWEGGFVQGLGGIAGQSTGFGGYAVDYAIRYDSAGLLYGNNIGYWDYKGWAVQVEGANGAAANAGSVAKYNADGALVADAVGASAETPDQVGAAFYFYDYLNDRTIASVDAKARQLTTTEYAFHGGAAIQSQLAKGLSVQAAAQAATETTEDAHLYADVGVKVDYKIKSYFTVSGAATYNVETAKDKGDDALKAEFDVNYSRKGISASSVSGATIMLTAETQKFQEIVTVGYSKDGISAGAKADVTFMTDLAPDTDLVINGMVHAGWNNDGNDIAFEDDSLSFGVEFHYNQDTEATAETSAFGVVTGTADVAQDDMFKAMASYSAEIMSDVTLSVSLEDTYTLPEAEGADASNVLVEKASITVVPVENASIAFAQTIKHETAAEEITENGFSVTASYSF